jgi:hypothetical protein
LLNSPVTVRYDDKKIPHLLACPHGRISLTPVWLQTGIKACFSRQVTVGILENLDFLLTKRYNGSIKEETFVIRRGYKLYKYTERAIRAERLMTDASEGGFMV